MFLGNPCPTSVAGTLAVGRWTLSGSPRIRLVMVSRLARLLNGIAGHVYPPSTTVDPLFGVPTVQVSAWYSQSRGYWYGHNEPADGIYEHPPSGWGYQFHGVPFRLPAPPTTATGPDRMSRKTDRKDRTFFLNDF